VGHSYKRNPSLGSSSFSCFRRINSLPESARASRRRGIPSPALLKGSVEAGETDPTNSTYINQLQNSRFSALASDAHLSWLVQASAGSAGVARGHSSRRNSFARHLRRGFLVRLLPPSATTMQFAYMFCNFSTRMLSGLYYDYTTTWSWPA
jgi:hypothetical protein